MKEITTIRYGCQNAAIFLPILKLSSTEKILQQLYVSNGVMKSVKFVGFQDFICQRDKKMSVLRTREPGLTPGTGSDKGASQDKKSRISQVRASLLSA